MRRTKAARSMAAMATAAPATDRIHPRLWPRGMMRITSTTSDRKYATRTRTMRRTNGHGRTLTIGCARPSRFPIAFTSRVRSASSAPGYCCSWRNKSRWRRSIVRMLTAQKAEAMEGAIAAMRRKIRMPMSKKCSASGRSMLARAMTFPSCEWPSPLTIIAALRAKFNRRTGATMSTIPYCTPCRSLGASIARNWSAQYPH
mmetsp:Transcript_14567/g.31675  ORF Transcript_14567/g.31675 Transcript_14567/m.31675 type:complete len:201 (-) Transcript_14567:6-608(-)